jgi:two-component system, OmpR family, response regulator
MTPTPAGTDRGSPRILVVEDDAAVRDGLVAGLALADYRVTATPDGTDVAAILEGFRPDAVLLDVYLGAGPDGFEVAQLIRTSSAAPILFLTAADTIGDRLRGFETGADDYIVKPFAIVEVLARIRAVLRRAGRLASPTLEVGDLLIDEKSRTAQRGGVPIDLTVGEFDLLAALARSAGTVLSKSELLVTVWGFSGYDTNLVEVYVSSLRRKLEVGGARLIFTVRGQGYVLRR